MPEDRVQEPIDDEEVAQEFDPSSLPLGTFAAFDVSDQPMWTTKEGEYQLTDDYRNAITDMTQQCASADQVARRTEVQGAWMLELLDRGLHRLKTTRDGGWEPFYGRNQGTLGMYGSAIANNFYDTNVIGEKNDIITACLTREIAESTFFAECPGNADDEVYAAAANALKHFIAEDNKYGERQAEVGRFFCTDETAIGYTRPVADAQRWGYEDNAPDVVPETADDLDPDAGGGSSQRPKIRTVSEMFGKLSRKVPIMAKDKAHWGYAMLANEIDVALAKSTYSWVAKEINSGDLGVAELKLDRLARQSICLALNSSYATGDSLMRDVTVTRIWFRPGFYMDDSCPKECRAWFWENFPKGLLAVFAGKTLAFARNESMDEVLTEFHARSGNGQNRRALTESYAGPQMRLNVMVDLWDEFCRKEIPRVGLDQDVWNVDAIRSSSVRVGVFEPFRAPVGRPAADTMVQFPQPQHAPTMPDFIMWLAGGLAEQLTHAQPALAASEGDDPETLGQSKLQNNNAMASFGESWKSILNGFANMTTQAVAWNARVQPETAKFDSNFPGRGRIQAQISDLKMGSGIARADGTANFPESWADRQAAWDQIISQPQIMQSLQMMDPRNLAAMREFVPRGMVLPGVDAVEKQQGEFDILLKTAPQDNPQFLKLQQLVQQGTQEIQMQAAQGMQPDPQALQALQQAQQMLQTMPPLISSVPIRPSDNDAVEALVCEGMLNAPDGRRLASSQDPEDQQHFQNLQLHWNQHKQAAAQKAQQNQQPIQPRTSITVDASKLDPQAQTSALQKMGIATTPEAVQQQEQLAPHEVTTKEKGVGPTGSEIERTTSVVGKSL
jgi:hypothetical protein